MNIEELRYLTQRPQRKTVVKGEKKKQETRSKKRKDCLLSTVNLKDYDK